jgi:tyrosine-protein kinase Etk/Wzc
MPSKAPKAATSATSGSAQTTLPGYGEGTGLGLPGNGNGNGYLDGHAPPPGSPGVSGTPIPLPPGSDDEPGFSLFDIVDLVLDHRWVIIVLTVVGLIGGLVAARVAAPIFESNLVLQVEQGRGQAGVLFSTATSLFDTASPTQTELEIMRSRTVLGRAVDNLQLTLYVRPKYLPLVGQYLANRASEPSSPGFLGQPGYVWGNERLRVAAFDVPPSAEGVVYTVVAAGNDGFQLRAPGGAVIAQGRVGQLLEFTLDNQPARLEVQQLVGLPGAEFVLSRRSRLAEVLSLQNRLQLTESGQRSGIVRVSMRGADRWMLPRILNEVGTQYVKQDLERKAEEAAKAMGFLGGLLPQIRKELEAAEGTFNQFRVQKGTFSLSNEASALLERSVGLQARLFELAQKRRELDSRYTPEHPQMRLLDQERASLEAELAKVKQSIDKLPGLEQDTLRLTRDVKVNTELYTSLLNTFQQLQLAKEGKVGNVRIVDPAEAPLGPVGPNRELMILLGLVGGLLVGLVAAAVRNLLNAGIKDPGEIEAKVQLPLLAAVPHSAQQKPLASSAQQQLPGVHVLAVQQPQDASIESLRSLRTAMQFAMLDAANNLLLVTGPTPGIGKSFISLNLAAVLGAAGKRVLLIDADLRKGRLHQFLGRQRPGGLTELILGAATLEQVLHAKALPNVDFIATGVLPPNPAELLLSAAHRGLWQQLGAQYDLVLVDTAPILVASDTAVLAPHCGTILLVARSLVTGLGELEEAKRRLAQTGVQAKGVVFNDLDLSRRRYGYGYGYKYGYKYGRYRYTQYKY